MRYLGGVLIALAVVAPPLIVSARDAEEGATPERTAEEGTPASETEREEPPLKLQVEEAHTEVVKMQRRVRNAKLGVAISGVSVLVGGLLTAAAFSEGILPEDPQAHADQQGLEIAAATLLVGGLASLLATGVLLAVRKGKLRDHERELRELRRDLPLGARGPGPVRAMKPQDRRVQWDLARSRLVF